MRKADRAPTPPKPQGVFTTTSITILFWIFLLAPLGSFMGLNKADPQGAWGALVVYPFFLLIADWSRRRLDRRSDLRRFANDPETGVTYNASRPMTQFVRHWLGNAIFIILIALIISLVLKPSVKPDEKLFFAVYLQFLVVFLWYRMLSFRRDQWTAKNGLKPYFASVFASSNRFRPCTWPRCFPGKWRSEIASLLDNDALVGAYCHADHGEEGRSAVKAEAERRGLPLPPVNVEWLPAAEHATLRVNVPSISRQEEFERFVRTRRRALTRIRMLAIAQLFLIGFFALSLIFIPLGHIFAIGQRSQEALFDVQEIEFLLGLLLICSVSLLTFMCIINVEARIDKPRAIRILLLRPFGQPEMTKALKANVVNYLGPVGHVVTLSDRDYDTDQLLWMIERVSQFVRYIYSPLVRPSFKIGGVTSERRLDNLAYVLGGSNRPEHVSLLTGGQAMNISTSDAWWKKCINVLMHSCPLIVMDLSKVGAGSEWEIIKIRELGMSSKCIFVAQGEFEAESSSILARIFVSQPVPIIHIYDKNGRFARPEQFETAASRCLSLS